MKIFMFEIIAIFLQIHSEYNFSLLRDFARSYSKTSYGVLERAQNIPVTAQLGL